MILAIDQGTTGTTCLVFDDEGRIARPRLLRVRAALPAAGLGRARRRRDLGGDAAGRRRGARRRRDRRARELERDRDHQPARDGGRLGPRRRRAAAPGARLAGPPHRRRAARSCARPGHEPLVRERTGLVLDPYFSGTKIEWLRAQRRGRARAGGVSARSTPGSSSSSPAEHATDYTNASRTMLFDIHRPRWDEELCELLGVDPARAARAAALRLRLRDDGGVRRRGPGRRDRRRPAGRALRPGLPSSRAGEEHLRDGQLRPPQHRRDGRPSPRTGLLTTVAWRTGERAAYALEASIFVTGAAVQWLRDGLGIIEERGARPRRWPPRSTATTASTSCRR